MSDDFDPYLEWMGIPPEKRPPSHYDLLGLPPFEADTERIHAAADKRIGRLHTLQLGEHAALAGELMHEIAAAQVCLCNPQRKAEYDAVLLGHTVEGMSLAEPRKETPIGLPAASQESATPWTRLEAAEQRPAPPRPPRVALPPPLPPAAPGAHLSRSGGSPMAAGEKVLARNLLRSLAVLVFLVGGAVTIGLFREKPLAPRDSLPQDSPTTVSESRPAPLPPLQFAPIPVQIAEAGKELAFVVTAQDVALQGRLHFSLASNSPMGARIDPDTGRFTWMPGESDISRTHYVAVFVETSAGQKGQTYFLITVAKPALRSETQITVDLGGGVAMELMLIAAGSFWMGSPESENIADDNEKPQNEVRISRPFYLSKYEVTQQQWQAVMESNPSRFRGPKNPVDSVSWHECQQFVERLNERLGKSGGVFGLPTEAQWEYACRAGRTTRYSFDEGEVLGNYVWFGGNSGATTHAVGEKLPNAWGLYDMHGNVWEWCGDWLDEDYYSISSAKDPDGPKTGSSRVMRGGSGKHPRSSCRSACRSGGAPEARDEFVGLRVARRVIAVPDDPGVAQGPEPLRLTPIPPQAVQPGKPLTVTVSVQNAEAVPGRFGFSLAGEGPPGVRVDGEMGVLTWTPDSEHASHAYSLVVWAESLATGQRAGTRFRVTVGEKRLVRETEKTAPSPAEAAESGNFYAIAITNLTDRSVVWSKVVRGTRKEANGQLNGKLQELTRLGQVKRGIWQEKLREYALLGEKRETLRKSGLPDSTTNEERQQLEQRMEAVRGEIRSLESQGGAWLTSAADLAPLLSEKHSRKAAETRIQQWQEAGRTRKGQGK